MKIKHVAGAAFLLNTFLFGSYYAISKEVLGRVDPIVFSFCEMMTLVPPGLIILAMSWRQMTRQAVKSGFLLGSCLCLGLFMLSVALRYNSATGTAFFPALNGLLAALFTWIVLRQPITKTTWFAGIVSVTGAFLLMANANMGGLRGSLIAFIGGLFCTMYIFLVDHEQKSPVAHWRPIFAVELLTMALWGNLIALLFGDWNMANFALPKDALIVLYIGLGTVFLPTLLTILLQKYISPVTVSFITIVEPIFGALVAFLYLHEVLPLDGYLGGGLIVAGVFIHTWGSVERPQRQAVLREGLRRALLGERFHVSPLAMLLYPLFCSGIGAYIVTRLGGFPPPVWRSLFQSLPQIPNMIQQGQGTEILIMVAQSLSWLIAWGSLLVMGGATTYRALEKLLMTVQYPPDDVQSVTLASSADWQYEPYAMAEASSREEQADYAPIQQAQDAMIEVSPQTEQVYPAFTNASDAQAQLRSLTADIDTRSLKQMGYTPYSVSTRPAKKKLNPVQLQQRRFQHRIRLAHIESPKAPQSSLDELPPTAVEQKATYNDARGNSYFCWDEIPRVTDILATYRLNTGEEVQEGS